MFCVVVVLRELLQWLNPVSINAKNIPTHSFRRATLLNT